MVKSESSLEVDAMSSTGNGVSAAGAENAPQPLSENVATMTLTQSILGSGVLALPYAFKSAGIVAGGVLLALIYFLSIFSMLALVLVGSHLGTFSFKDGARGTLGNRLSTIIEAWVLMFNLGICVSYVVLLGTFLHEISDGLGGDNANAHWPSPQGWSLIAVLCICWPLSCSPSLGFLQWTSMLGITSILFSVIVVVLRYSDGTYHRPEYDRNDLVAINMSSFGNCFPILVGAFGAHFNIPGLYRELAPEAVAGGPGFAGTITGKLAFRRMGRVITKAITLSTFVYGTVGILVYATFGDDTHDNFTKNFATSDRLVVLVRFLMTLSVCASFPLVMVSARSATANLVLQPYNLTLTPRLRIVVSTVLVFICLLLGVAAGGDLGTVLDYNGAVFGTPVCYIAPGVMYLRLPKVLQRRGWRLFCATCAGLGALLAGLGIVVVSMEKASPGHQTQ